MTEPADGKKNESPSPTPPAPRKRIISVDMTQRGHGAIITGVPGIPRSRGAKRPALSARFEEAMVFAARHHAHQLRKGTAVPYVAHVLGVASIALEHGATEDEAIAALLHDAVEDTPGGPGLVRAEILQRFGPAVLDIVNGCIDSDTQPKPPFRERKERYLAHLPTASPSIRLVSASDKLYNARAILSDYRAIGEALWTRFTGGRDGTLWYYRALAQAFGELGPSRLAEELDRVVTEIEHLAEQGRATPTTEPHEAH